MKVQDCDPPMERRVPFDHGLRHTVPARPGCYCLANIFDDILYVGQTKSLHRRMKEHLDDSRMTQRTDSGLPSWYYFAEFDETKIHQVEDQLLGEHIFREGTIPRLNRIGP